MHIYMNEFDLILGYTFLRDNVLFLVCLLFFFASVQLFTMFMIQQNNRYISQFLECNSFEVLNKSYPT